LSHQSGASFHGNWRRFALSAASSSIGWRESAPPILRQSSFRIGTDAVVTAQSIERQNGATQAP
jgi:hypothetical protein